MARTILTIDTLGGAYPVLPVVVNSLDITETAADVVDNNRFLLTGREILIARNSTGGALTFTVHSVVDDYERDGDITTYSVGANESAAFGPVKKAGWEQADGYAYIDGSAVGLLFTVLRLP